LGRSYWANVFYRMAHAHLYLLRAELVGVLGCWRDHVPDWHLARLLFVVCVIRHGHGHETGAANVACAGDGD
jgi:hypothetical protein